MCLNGEWESKWELLSEDFSYETNMLVHQTEYGTFHETRKSAHLAKNLLAIDTKQAVVWAEKIIEAVLDCQNTNVNCPQYGNFKWMREDDVIEDLNCGEFVLESFIPMMIKYGERLSSDLKQRVEESIYICLKNIERLDVKVAYTNITVLDIMNTCLGGEYLNDMAIANRGYNKLVDWIVFTNRSGIPAEYNSPTYTTVVLRALKTLTEYVKDNETRVRAKAMSDRISLSVGLHIHQETGRWSGPHSRGYLQTITADNSAEPHAVQTPEIRSIHDFIEEGVMPYWIDSVLHREEVALQSVETAEREKNFGYTTYHSKSFSIGTCTKNHGGQDNNFIIYYTLGEKFKDDRCGVLFSRYLLNDKWIGSFYHQTNRTNSANLNEQGEFLGAQDGSRAICVYSPHVLNKCSSAKATLVCTNISDIDEIWLGESKVTSLPADIPSNEVIVLVTGNVFIAIKPLVVTKLGPDAPKRLIEKDGALLIELHQYKGSPKSFWEIPMYSSFYRGREVCSFYTEVAERSDYIDASQFCSIVAGGRWDLKINEPFPPNKPVLRTYTAAYSREGFELGMEVDITSWRLNKRWNHNGEIKWDMLECDIARQNAEGYIEVGNATLQCGKESAWLYADEQKGLWVAGYLGLTPQSLKLSTPQGTIEIASMGIGTVIWDNGNVNVEAIQVSGEPKISI